MVLQAVAGMHERNVAWRDATPANIQITGTDVALDPEVVVVDFGLSVLMHQGNCLTLLPRQECHLAGAETQPK